MIKLPYSCSTSCFNFLIVDYVVYPNVLLQSLDVLVIFGNFIFILILVVSVINSLITGVVLIGKIF
jgi:hypothetical protein